MENIKILDCTLRDGGRIIECKFRDDIIKNIAGQLTRAHMDIVEMGFLRDGEKVVYHGDSTFFTEAGQIEPFIPKQRGNTIYTAFIDYGMYNFSMLEEYNGKSVDGIRVGFTKNDFKNSRNGLIKAFQTVMEKGYKLFVQGVNTPAYQDLELLEMIEMVNSIRPYSFGIVDTYGAMYVENVKRLFELIDHNLKPGIRIDLHSHNNFQLSFAIAQEIINLSGKDRQVIIDATLDGMGKCAGNLNTELVTDYLVRMKNSDYEIDVILDVIDDYIEPIKKKTNWGYSVPAFMAGIYKAHPNNVIYMTEKHKMETKDIRHIMATIEEPVRQRYDYDNIEKIYIKYMDNKIDDSEAIRKLKELIGEKEVLVLAPGNSLIKYDREIRDYIKENSPFIISVNFLFSTEDYCFVGYKKRYEVICSGKEGKFILPSNIKGKGKECFIVNYEGLINRGYKFFDNSTVMLLNLLKKLEVKKISIAGFDGFYKNKDSNFIDLSFDDERRTEEFEAINEEMYRMMNAYLERVRGKIKVRFLTPSLYQKESIYHEKEK